MAKFLYFKTSGKYYAEGEGELPENVFSPFEGNIDARQKILGANFGHMPGLSTTGSNFIVVVIPEDAHKTGWPLHLAAME